MNCCCAEVKVNNRWLRSWLLKASLIETPLAITFRISIIITKTRTEEEKKKEKRLLYPLGLNGKYATSHSHNILKVSPTEYCMPLLLLHFKNRFSLSTIFQSIIFHEISIALDLTTLWTDWPCCNCDQKKPIFNGYFINLGNHWDVKFREQTLFIYWLINQDSTAMLGNEGRIHWYIIIEIDPVIYVRYVPWLHLLIDEGNYYCCWNNTLLSIYCTAQSSLVVRLHKCLINLDTLTSYPQLQSRFLPFMDKMIEPLSSQPIQKKV